MTVTSARVAFALAVLAGVVHLGLARRWQAEAAEHNAARQGLLRQEREAQRRLRDLDREARLRAEATALVGKSASTLPSDAALQKVRARVVAALERGARSRLEVRPGPAPALATVALWTVGDFVDLVERVAALSHPGSGLILSRAVFVPDIAGTAAVQLEALALGAGDTP